MCFKRCDTLHGLPKTAKSPCLAHEVADHMNLSLRWLKLLHDAAWEAEHWSHIGRPSAPDSEVMVHAAAHGYVVVAHDPRLCRNSCHNARRKAASSKFETKMLRSSGLAARLSRRCGFCLRSLNRERYSRLKWSGPACGCCRFVRLLEYIQKAGSVRNPSAKIFCNRLPHVRQRRTCSQIYARTSTW